MDDALIYMLQRTYEHVDTVDMTEDYVFFYFSSSFNTIKVVLLGEKMRMMQVVSTLVSCVTDCLTCRPHYVQLQNCVSNKILCSTGGPQGTVLYPFHFILYMSDFWYNSDSCFL